MLALGMLKQAAVHICQLFPMLGGQLKYLIQRSIIPYWLGGRPLKPRTEVLGFVLCVIFLSLSLSRSMASLLALMKIRSQHAVLDT